MPIIAVLAVALCVTLVIVVVSVMTGFLEMLRDSGKRLVGDVIIHVPTVGMPYYRDLIADMPAGDAGAEFNDLARGFQPERGGCAGRRWVKAGALGDVWPVYTGGGDADENFVRAWAGNFVFHQRQRLIGGMRHPLHRLRFQHARLP